MDFCGFDLTFRSNVCRIVIAPLPQKGSLRYHLFGDPGRGNDTGKPWHRLVTGIFQGSLLLSTQGQRHLSYVQANGKVSHYAPVGVVAARLAKVSFFACCALVLRAFSRIAGYLVVNVL